MSSTRDVKSPGIFAENASTAIPPSPIQGVAYRDAVNGTGDIADGWPYAEKVQSQDWNQIMFLMTSMLGILDKNGMLGYSSTVDYELPAVTHGSDGEFYQALQPNGPSTSVQDPVSSPTYWRKVAMRNATNTEMTAGLIDNAGATPQNLLGGFLGAGGTGGNDYAVFPYRDKTTGVRRELIIQWVEFTFSGAGAGTATVSLPTPISAYLAVIPGDKSTAASAQSATWRQDLSTSTDVVFYTTDRAVAGLYNALIIAR